MAKRDSKPAKPLWDATVKPNQEMILGLLRYKRNKKENPIVEEAPLSLDEEELNGCQGCGGTFTDDDVMIVEKVGPVCFNCLFHLATFVLE